MNHHAKTILLKFHMHTHIQDWEMLGFLQSLKGYMRASNSVAMITFPASLLSSNFSVRWKHMADVLLAVEAVPGDGFDLFCS